MLNPSAAPSVNRTWISAAICSGYRAVTAIAARASQVAEQFRRGRFLTPIRFKIAPFRLGAASSDRRGEVDG